VTTTQSATLRALRIYHSGVVRAWRARDDKLADEGILVTLVCARASNEGGTIVHPDIAAGEQDVHPIRTLGRHPNLFMYDPIALWRLLRHARYDVLDVHEEPVSVAAAEIQLLAFLARVRAPFCLYSAQNIEKRYPIPFRWMERVALRRAAAVHTCNDAAGGILRRKGFRGIVENLGLGIDIERFAPAEPSTTDVLRVGYVGRIEARKGVHVLVDAIERLIKSTLEIVGDGPDRPAVEAQIARLGITDRVTVTGFALQDDLPERYRSFDVLAVPSLDTAGWIEQFGRVAVEAMACGVPVVASRSGSLPEVVADTGILVPPGDADALRVALLRLAENPIERRRLGTLARQRAHHYSWASIAAQQAVLYREMLEHAT
jgi:glycosyltransferase involved in cell wall biosynthesis